MRFRFVAAVGALALTASLATAAAPAQAKITKTFTGTIAVATAELSSTLGAGNANGAGSAVTPARQTCPSPGVFDGVFYRFFDLKGDYTAAKVSGPKVAFSQALPGGVINHAEDYDLDLYVLDAKCKLFGGFSSNTGGATEKGSSKKPFRYVVAVYWAGPYPNIPVTVEVSR